MRMYKNCVQLLGNSVYVENTETANICTKRAQPTNPVECVQSLTQKHVAKWYMIAEKLLPLHHES